MHIWDIPNFILDVRQVEVTSSIERTLTKFVV